MRQDVAVGGKPAARRTADAPPQIVRLGRVVNGYSSFLSLLAVDAELAPEWNGPSNGGENDDFARANDAVRRGNFAIDVGDGAGVVVEVGGCGTADIFRLGTDRLVAVEHYADDWDDDLEAAFIAAVVSTPTSPDCHKLGSVDVPSGVLGLVALVESVGQIAGTDLAAIAGTSLASGTQWGLLAGMPRGRYDIWSEPLGEIRGQWGLITSRFRVVPAKMPVVCGEPVAAPPRRKPTRSRHAAARRYGPDGWVSVESFATAAQRLFAGQRGGDGVACFARSGERLWQRQLAGEQLSGPLYQFEVTVHWSGADNRLIAGFDDVLYFLDPSTGEVTGKHSGENDLRNFALSPDGSLLVLRVSTETKLLSYPALETIALLDHYVNGSAVALSPDGRWLAVAGHDAHMFELSPVSHAVTFTPPESPSALAFSADSGLLAVASDDGTVRTYRAGTAQLVRELDIAPERLRKPGVNTLAFDPTGRYLATGSDDGSVKLWGAGDLELRARYDKHDTSIPDTGHRSLAQVGFDIDGTTLIVSACAKTQPVGVSAYPLP